MAPGLVDQTHHSHELATPTTTTTTTRRGNDQAEPSTVAMAPRQDKQSLEYILKNGLVGGIAGCTAKTVVAPLDRVKLLLQTANPQFIKYSGSPFALVSALREIYVAGGLLSLFRGHQATLLRVYPYAAIKFVAYEQIRSVLIPTPAHETSLRRFACGSLAGLASLICTYPLELIRNRLGYETRKDAHSSLREICRKIYHEGAGANPSSSAAVRPYTGMVNFYRGLGPSLIGMIPYAGVSFLTYDTARDFLRRPALALYTTIDAYGDQTSPLRPWAQLSAGAVSGILAATTALPLDVIRHRMQVSGAIGSGRRRTIRETARTIMAERGLRGFWTGLGISAVKVIPLTSIAFYTYDRGKRLVGI